MEFVPGKGDPVLVVVTGGLVSGGDAPGGRGDAPGGREAREEEREEVKGTSFVVSAPLFDSEDRTCQCSSSDERWVSRLAELGRR